MNKLPAACATLGLAFSAAAPASTGLVGLAWMAGHWVGEPDQGQVEEIWMAPAGGSMVGSFRWVVPGQMHVLEFLVIEETPGAVFFRFKHFHRDYRAWEAEPNTYRLVRSGDRSASFELVNDNPRVPARIRYLSPAPDRLVFIGEGSDPGEEPLRLEFRRKPD